MPRIQEYNMLGDIVIGGCSTINLMEIVFLIVKLFEGARAIDEYIMTHPKYPRTIWLQLFAFVGQQGGMGFEEMFVEPEAEEIFKAPKYMITNVKRRDWPESQQEQAVQDRARGVFSASQPVRPNEQESTLVSFFHDSSKDVVRGEPVRTREDVQVGSISNLVPREDPEISPFYWLDGITRLERHGPRNAKKPKMLELSSRGRSESIQDRKSQSPRRKKSSRKHKKKHGGGGGAKITHL